MKAIGERARQWRPGDLAHGILTLSPDARATIAVFIVATLLRLNHLGLPQDNYDEGVYLASLRALANGHALFTEVYSAQPPGFLLMLYPSYLLLGKTLLAARLGVMLYSLIGLAAMWWLGKILGGPRAGLVALALLAFDPQYLTLSRAVQAEAPALAFAVLAVALAASTRFQPNRNRALLAGVAFGVSLLIKLFTIPAVIPLVCFLAMPTFGGIARQALPHRALPSRADLTAAWRVGRGPLLAFLIGIFLALVVGLLPFLSHAGLVWQQVIGLHLAATSALVSDRSHNLGLFLAVWWELPLVLAGLMSAYLGWRRMCWEPMILVAWGLACLLVLAVQTPLFDHHLVLFVPPFIAAVALLPALVPLPKQRGIPRWLRSPGMQRAVSGILIVLLLISMGKSIGQEVAETQHPPVAFAQVADDIQLLTQPDDLVVTDDQIIVDLADRAVPPALVDTSLVRISSGQLTTAQIIAAASDPRVTAVLWYSGRFDTLPGWRVWVTGHFIRAVDYGNGRALYVRTALPPSPVG